MLPRLTAAFSGSKGDTKRLPGGSDVDDGKAATVRTFAFTLTKTLEWNLTRTAPHIVDPARVLGNLLADTSPDLTRSLLLTMITALLSGDRQPKDAPRHATATASDLWSRGRDDRSRRTETEIRHLIPQVAARAPQKGGVHADHRGR